MDNSSSTASESETSPNFLSLPRKRKGATKTWYRCFCCDTTSWKNPERRFFGFPKDPVRSKQWAAACNKDLLNISADELYRKGKVCSIHFTESDFRTTKFRYLHSCAVPKKLGQTADEITYRQQNLRKMYPRKERTAKSGDEANTIKKSWPRATQTSFLAPVVISIKTMNNNASNEEADAENIDGSTSFCNSITESNESQNFSSDMATDEENEFIATTSEYLTKMTKRTQKDFNCRTDVSCTTTAERDATDEFLQLVKSSSSVLSKSEEDSDKNFLLSLLPDFKKLNREKKHKAKIEILNLLHELGEKHES